VDLTRFRWFFKIQGQTYRIRGGHRRTECTGWGGGGRGNGRGRECAGQTDNRPADGRL
jgi:hypothetical protein